jgi:small subunit ribosomal protein S16
MLKVRLQRVGRKNDPSFRVVVTNSLNAPKSGKFLEVVGSYDARKDRIDLKGERIKHWISNGAQVSDTVHNLLVSKKVIEGKKINVLPKKKPIVKEGAKVEAPPEAAPSEPAPVETPAE